MGPGIRWVSDRILQDILIKISSYPEINVSQNSGKWQFTTNPHSSNHITNIKKQARIHSTARPIDPLVSSAVTIKS